MALFVYKAIDERAAAVEGSISADSPRAARDLLRNRGLTIEMVSSQREPRGFGWWPFRRRNRYVAKRVEAIRELSTLLASGIPLLDALDSLVAQHQGGFRESLLQVRERVAAGSSLAEAMREQPQVYDELSLHMVEVGENSGTLDTVLDQLANFSERYLQLKDRVTSALFYPVVVFLLSMGVGVWIARRNRRRRRLLQSQFGGTLPSRPVPFRALLDDAVGADLVALATGELVA